MTDTVPDRKALEKLGARVRERLARDPSVYRIPVEEAELFAVGDFLDDRECRAMIELIDCVAEPSQLYDETYIEAYRTSYSGDIPQDDSEVRMIERRLSDLLGIDISWGERVQGQRYAPGQQYREHCDFFDVNAAYWKDEKARGGQRSWTAMIYLSDVEEGGETAFPSLGISVSPQKGSLLVWNNASADGTPNMATMHAATPVVQGTKYVITKWFRTRPWA
ncbi:2OG-Fe(II) oxygenase [Novosphingobium sp. PC22D]|uniref:prolyl hydroxylase family protein n=1 Tax=Novosphingobium sp. PC22D TaxID=1962403 RepID=UPI000BEFE57D|nr:2OG-Fe(II) oxygenase [Novosphingobium sp. PC22D]PEQ13457.1 2OG-Fe(II) oxygenase [Novosphingobium sp. PC22D]